LKDNEFWRRPSRHPVQGFSLGPDDAKDRALGLAGKGRPAPRAYAPALPLRLVLPACLVPSLPVQGRNSQASGTVSALRVTIARAMLSAIALISSWILWFLVFWKEFIEFHFLVVAMNSVSHLLK